MKTVFDRHSTMFSNKFRLVREWLASIDLISPFIDVKFFENAIIKSDMFDDDFVTKFYFLSSAVQMSIDNNKTSRSKVSRT